MVRLDKHTEKTPYRIGCGGIFFILYAAIILVKTIGIGTIGKISWGWILLPIWIIPAAIGMMMIGALIITLLSEIPSFKIKKRKK